MVANSSAMCGWKWTEVSVLGSQVFGKALAESFGKATASLLQLSS